MRRAALLAGVAALTMLAGAGRVEAQSVPGAPATVSAGTGAGTLTVLWTPPADTGGSAVTAYDLRHIPAAADETVDANWTVIEGVWVTGGGALSHQLPDLEDGVGFDVQVRAVNASGDGPWSATATATTTDHGGTAATATDLAPGSSRAGRLGTAGDEDVFAITLAADGELWIYATGPLDTVAELLDSAGAVLAESDDGTLLDGSRGFEFREELTAGTYYVRVSSYEGREAGSYRIHALTVTDPGSTFETATDVTLDSATPGRIGPTGGRPNDRPAGDADYFRLVLTATADVWVMAFGRQDGDEDEVLDTEGFLYGASQNQLLYADDSELVGNEEGFMLRRSLAAGTYYIRVNGFSTVDTGPYTLHVRTAAEPGGTAATATPLTLLVPETGRITSSSDHDYFSLALDEDLYVFLYAVTFGSRQALTPTVFDDQGTEVSLHLIPHASWNEHGLGAFSFSLWGKLDAGTYHIRIAGSTGSYLLDPLPSPYNRQLEECTAIATPQSDPWYGCQWHLNNTGQFPGGALEDINVESVWSGGNMGEGVNIAIVDDGLEDDHVDLVDNVVSARNHDYTGQAGVYDPLESHGTAVAGLIAARDNDIGVRGVAPRAGIFAYNLIARGSSVTASAASAMFRSEDAQVTAVSNNSWGNPDTGLPLSAGALWERAVRRGVTEGYGGKGIVYVWAAGNGHEGGDHANLDGYTNHYAVTAACAVGYDDRRSAYSEIGANLWVCAPSSSGREDLPKITTTHIPDRYRDTFGGTSAATPIVSGVAALVRAANADLSWRDVKLILAASARKNDAANAGWDEGALQYGSTSERYEFNHEYGFGVVDAAAAVALAGGWAPVPAMRTIEARSGPLEDPLNPGSSPAPLPDREGDTVVQLQAFLALDAYVSFVEFVEIEIELEHEWFRDLRIEIESPGGETSVLSVPALAVARSSGRFSGSHRFGSARHLGESAEGTWTLKVTDFVPGETGVLKSWRLRVYGHGRNPGYVTVHPPVAGGGALTVAWDAPAEAGSSDVTSYDLRYILDDAPDKAAPFWTVVPGAGSVLERSHTVTGLEAGQKYRVAVRAVNSDGDGPWVEGGAVETLALEPGPPRSVALAARDGALAVSWREPSFSGAGVTAYDLRYIRDDAPDKGDAFWTDAPGAWSTGSGELRYVIRGLEDGVAYQVQVRARNPRAAGAWSPPARGTPAEVNGPAEFPATETGRRGIPENTPPGVAIGDPVAARDDEGDPRTYSLTAGAASFDIDPATGQLRTRAALDHERSASHAVTVAVHDGRSADGAESTAIDDTIRVTIAVTDVDEPPVVSGAGTPSVRENAAAVAAYRAGDPERAATIFTWALAGDDAGAFAISDTGVLAFDPAPDFEARADRDGDNVYEVTIRATDESATEPAAMTGELEVSVTVQDVDEPPEIAGSDSFVIAEGGSTFVGGYTASDPEGTATTWLSLTGADARFFTLDEFGSLSFVATPDYDRATNGNHAPGYRVTVRASDEGNRIASFPVTITLTNVDEAPLINGPAGVTVDEGHTGTVATYTKRDPEGSTSNWGPRGGSAVLSGRNGAAFAFDQASGRLTFASPPDYEGGGASYAVTLNANDGSLTGTLDVTVTVTNLDETGSLAFDRRTPVIGRSITATLADPDTVAGTVWRWHRSTSRTGGWTEIGGAQSSAYTPAGGDRTHYLRATVVYEDGHGPGKSRQLVTEFPVTNDRAANTAPALPASVDDVEIPENSRPGRNVGGPVRATDAENDTLVYSLSGAAEFVIDERTAQIRVAPGAAFDYDEGARSYSLTVSVDDGFGGTDSTGVTVRITDVNEPPEAADDAPRAVDEDTPATIDVLANDRDPEDARSDLVVTILRRPANGSVTLTAPQSPGERPTITYTPRADYNGSDSFTYRLRDSGNRTSSVATVALTITSVNDAPAFATATAERSVSEEAEEGDAVGAPVRATDVDGDRLRYSLTGPGEFDVDGDTGQIRVAPGAVLVPGAYEVTVRAQDPRTAEASVVVTITVTAGPAPAGTRGGGGGFAGGGGGGGGGGPSGPTPSTVDFEWTVKEDIEALDPGHGTPTGSWSDGATLWLLENGSGADDAVYAYDLGTGERAGGREFELDERNRAPRGAWSDGETIWISDSGRDRLFAHDLASGERLEERDLELARENRDARGIWSGGGTVWVLDGGRDALFAYDLESGAFLAGYALDAANGDPHGLWSDGVTLWVSNHDPKRLFAYRLPALPDEPPEEPLPLAREDDLDFTTLSSASNNSPRGVWSDGSVMYVADELDGRVYSYNMPDAIDARLASLALEGVDIGAFDPRRTDYEGVIAGGVTETTVEAEAVQRGTQVVIDPPDADPGTEGHQVTLAGLDAITVRVTSADGSRTRTYRVDLGSDEPDEPWPHCLLGDVAAGFSLVVYEGGAVEDLAACAESRNVVALYALHEGVYLPLIPGAPGFVNEAFRELYPEGVPALTALVAASAGPPGSDPVGDLGAPRSWPRCLRGELAEGFSLLVYEGGSIEDLAACAERLAVTALYALEDGQWVSYIPGAPGFVNEPFRELFAGGVPPVTPLVVRSDGPPPTGSDGDGAEGNSE